MPPRPCAGRAAGADAAALAKRLHAARRALLDDLRGEAGAADAVAEQLEAKVASFEATGQIM